MKLLRRITITTTVLLSLASSLPAFQSSDWIKFAPAGGGFTVMLPVQPKEIQTETIPDFTGHTFGVVVGQVVYVICYGDYAPSVRLDPDAELLANRDNFLKPLNGTATG